MTIDPKDKVATYLALTVGLFVLATLLVVFVLALNGIGLPEVWTSLFGLVIAIMSALGGWLVGSSTAKRNGNDSNDDGGSERVQWPPSE